MSAHLVALRCADPHPLNPSVLCVTVGAHHLHDDGDGNRWTTGDPT